MTGSGPVAVLGATGFVGRAVVAALQARSIEVVAVRAPRVSGRPSGSTQAVVDELAAALEGCTAVVNAAGLPDAAGGDLDRLRGANSALPGLVARAARRVGVRMVHVSSAAVQGPRTQLDSAERTDAFSPYSRSKADGERAALAAGGDSVVVYRPPGVHGADRPLTRSVARLARSPLSSVAGDGRRTTAMALAPNVGDAIAFLATTPLDPPRIVHHPSEGLTTAALLRSLGGREPRHVPESLAAAALATARRAAKIRPSLLAHVRRLEMLWFGQEQAASWLTEAGWTPVHTHAEWDRLGSALRDTNDGTRGR